MGSASTPADCRKWPKSTQRKRARPLKKRSSASSHSPIKVTNAARSVTKAIAHPPNTESRVWRFGSRRAPSRSGTAWASLSRRLAPPGTPSSSNATDSEPAHSESLSNRVTNPLSQPESALESNSIRVSELPAALICSIKPLPSSGRPSPSQGANERDLQRCLIRSVDSQRCRLTRLHTPP